MSGIGTLYCMLPYIKCLIVYVTVAVRPNLLHTASALSAVMMLDLCTRLNEHVPRHILQ